MGLDMQTIMMRDGSGISQVHMIPANEITKLLYAIREKTWFPAYLNALPIAGNENPDGKRTLRKRMKGTLRGRECPRENRDNFRYELLIRLCDDQKRGKNHIFQSF